MERIAVGLALSGGTAKSLAHIGVIRALEENGIAIDYLAGTSGGAIVAVLYAAGRSVDDLERLADGIRWRKLAGLTLPKLGLLSGAKIRDFIIEEIGDMCFDDLKIPTAVVASDLTTGSKVVFRSGRIAVACQASSSIPEVYSPVEIDGHFLVDGGLIEYLPVETLGEFGEMFKIGVNLGLTEGIRRRPRHLIEVIMQVTGFVSQQNALVSEEAADFIICPHMESFSPFAFQLASDMVNHGYMYTLEVIPAVKKAMHDYASLGGRLGRWGRGLLRRR